MFGSLREAATGAFKRLRQVGDDVVDMLDPDRQPDIARRDAGIALL